MTDDQKPKTKNLITPAQLRAIWGAAKRQAIDESTLRDLVEAETGARSISAMSTAQAATVLNRLLGTTPLARSDGRGAGGGGHPAEGEGRRFADLGERRGMATPRQLRKIEAMWRDRSRMPTAAEQDAALRAWLTARWGVGDLRFLSRFRASDVIVALEKMEVIRAA